MKVTCQPIVALLALSLFVAVSRAQEVTGTIQAGDGSAAPAESTQSSLASNGSTGVRIVRLSLVKGAAQLDRKTGRGFEEAFTNLPVAQGQRLKTDLGVAEVEFEDNSSLRIIPDSLVDFPVLQRGPTGATANHIQLLNGTLYVSLANTKGNEFSVILGNTTLVLAPSSHIRLDAGTSTSKATLAVFSGTVQVTDASGTTVLGKKKTLTFDAATQAPPVLTSKLEDGIFDGWDKKETDYHKLRSISSAYGNSPYSYGINDLNYYGSFVNVGGCGTMWRPYFASAAWDPYANGVWAWYPGSGYTWVSPYPWGWTPFHSGSWDYCPGGGGWGWRPSSTWHGLRNHPTTPNPTHAPNCPKPPHAPVAGGSTLVVANTRPLSVSRVTSPDTFVFRKDSAGLGVPRDAFGKLNKVSAGVERHGSVSAPIYIPMDHGSNASNSGGPYAHENGSRGELHSSLIQNRANATPANSGQAGRPTQGASRTNSPSPSSGGWSGGGSHMPSSGGSSGGWSGGGGSHMSSPAPAPSAPASGGSSSSGAGSHR